MLCMTTMMLGENVGLFSRGIQVALYSIGKSGFRVLQSNAKSENGFHLPQIRPYGGFQLRNPNPDFMDFLLLFDSETEKEFAKLFSWTVVFFLLIMRARARPLFLRTVYQISQKNGKKENSRTDISVLKFAFDCKSKTRVLKSKSRFPNWTHPQRKDAIR